MTVHDTLTASAPDQRALWDSRAHLGAQAGTRDVIAAELERRAIGRYVKAGMHVLDVGCGNGTTALWLARKANVKVAGFDPSPEMIAAARAAIPDDLRDRVAFFNFGLADVVQLADLDIDRWDLVYSQRCLINLGTWERQEQAIRQIVSWLKPGGTYLAVECSQDGLDAVNDLRAAVDLPSIRPPVHNRYLRDAEMAGLGGALWNEGKGWLVASERIASTYALLSRVVNAALARDEGREPEYDSPVNQLALRLPNVGEIGQNTVYRFERRR